MITDPADKVYGDAALQTLHQFTIFIPPTSASNFRLCDIIQCHILFTNLGRESNCFLRLVKLARFVPRYDQLVTRAVTAYASLRVALMPHAIIYRKIGVRFETPVLAPIFFSTPQER